MASSSTYIKTLQAIDVHLNGASLVKLVNLSPSTSEICGSNPCRQLPKCGFALQVIGPSVFTCKNS